MVTQKTAERIWNCYREIEVGKKLLSDIEEARKDERNNKYAVGLKDVFGRVQHLQLGVPIGQDGQRLFQVAPKLAESVIRAHIANKEAELVEVNEQARIELLMGVNHG